MTTNDRAGASSVATQHVAERKEPAPPPKAPPEPVGLVVERLNHENIPAVCALYKRVWDAFRPELPPEILKSWEPSPLEFSSQMEGVTYFAAREGGKMLGAIGCSFSNGSCRFVQIVVDPEARRRGIGTQLIRAGEEWARHNNVREVWVDALTRFNGAAEMLKHLGFTEAGVLHRHFWGEDVRFFERLL
jgi:GNAT superfamily N-acetyltransferase